jgi:hypothetical protein
MESADNGLTWSAPIGIISGSITIGGQPPAGNFALSDVVVVNGQRVVYFNYPVAGGNLIVGALPPAPTSAVSVQVPVDAPWMLAVLVAVLTTLAVFRLRRSSARWRH